MQNRVQNRAEKKRFFNGATISIICRSPSHTATLPLGYATLFWFLTVFPAFFSNFAPHIQTDTAL